MKITKNDTLFSISLIFAIWFALTGIIWVYGFALFISYPFGLISFLLWWRIRNEQTKRIKSIPIILSAGLILSLIVLVSLLLFG